MIIQVLTSSRVWPQSRYSCAQTCFRRLTVLADRPLASGPTSTTQSVFHFARADAFEVQPRQGCFQATGFAHIRWNQGRMERDRFSRTGTHFRDFDFHRPDAGLDRAFRLVAIAHDSGTPIFCLLTTVL